MSNIDFQLQVCRGCAQHKWCTRHKEERYDLLYNQIKSRIEQLDHNIRVHTIENPTIGAFEIRQGSKTIFSKLKLGYFPDIQLLMERVTEHLKKENGKQYQDKNKGSAFQSQKKGKSKGAQPKGWQQKNEASNEKSKGARQKQSNGKSKGKEEQKKREQKKKEQKKEQSKPANLQGKTQFQRNYISVNVLNAVLTRDTQTFGKMDPFVVLKVAGKQQRTKTAQGQGKQPKFDETFDFQIDPKDVLQILVREQDVNDSDQIGVAKISAQTLMKNQGRQNKFAETIYFQAKQAGTINLAITYTVNYLHKMRLIVQGALLTRDTQAVGKMDPFAEFRVKNQVFRTKVVEGGGKEPKWNEEFIFDLIDPKNEMLQYCVNQEDLSSNELVGKGEQKVRSLLQGGKRSLKINFEGKSAGQIFVTTIHER